MLCLKVLGCLSRSAIVAAVAFIQFACSTPLEDEIVKCMHEVLGTESACERN
jgi:hypothetical protein